jgi:large conductance mechanosensitive channel
LPAQELQSSQLEGRDSAVKYAKEFKQFLLRGNVVDLAVAVVIGAVFGAVVSALVADLLTPLIAAIFGKPDFSSLTFTIHNSVFKYGDFINAVITFLIVAVVVFFFVVRPINALITRSRKEPSPDPTLRKCPECTKEISVDARRCPFCTSQIGTR